MRSGISYGYGDAGAYSRQIAAWRFGQAEPLPRPRRQRTAAPTRGRSPIEHILAGLLAEAGFAFRMNQQVGKYEVDFILDPHGVVIEANGRWFHNPQKDSRKANYLYEHGYRVIQVSGSDIVNRPEKTMDDILRKLRMLGIGTDGKGGAQ